MSRVSVIFHGHRVSTRKVSLLPLRPDWSLERRSLEYVNVNIGKRVADILSKRSGGVRATIEIDKDCRSISQFGFNFFFFIVSPWPVEKSVSLLQVEIANETGRGIG